MSTSREDDAVRSRISSKLTQPIPPRADENIKLVQRKIDQNLKLAQPRISTGDPGNRLELPGSPILMAQVTQPRERAVGEVPVVRADEVADPDSTLAQASEIRMANQWKSVTQHLLRDFAPDGGADADVVLAHIAEQRRILDSAMVRDYLPVLVDRAVRQLLAPDENGR
jgi:hypothetical protein